MNALARTLFSAIASILRAVPPFRGKVRVAMFAFRVLGGHAWAEPQTVHLPRPVRHRMKLDIRAWAQRLAFVDGGYEPETVVFLRAVSAKTISPGYLLDIGACIGAIAIPYAVARRDELAQTVVAFEAVADNVKLLRENVALNELNANVTVHDVALGESSKTVAIQVEGDRNVGEGSGTANILAENSDYDCVRQTINVRRMDDLHLPRGCGVIKIDTDGYDLKVLQGGTEFLSRERPIVFGEFSAHCMGWHGQSVHDVRRLCEQAGYELFAKVGDKFRFTKVFDHESFVQDLLLVPAEKLDVISVYLVDWHRSAQ
jgi:FkbM family methyltransferase